MYEIHINHSRIFLIKTAFLSTKKKGHDILFFKYNEKTKYLLNFIDKAEKSKESLTIYIHHPSLIKLKSDFFSLYHIIKAGGGLVLNKEGKVLMIFRRGSWDLPKGKKEKGEKKKQTAVREVQEETGLNDVRILQPLPDTYHTYRTSTKRVLKQSYWYIMETEEKKLIPQLEEDIEKAVWVHTKELKNGSLKPIYGNIERLIGLFLDQI